MVLPSRFLVGVGGRGWRAKEEVLDKGLVMKSCGVMSGGVVCG